MNRRLVIVPVHGEHRSVWHVADPNAPEDEQPCILASRDNLADAEAARNHLEGEERPCP